MTNMIASDAKRGHSKFMRSRWIASVARTESDDFAELRVS